jgi:hypothetical protein
MPGIHGSRAHAENVLFCVCWSHLPPVLRLGAACEVHTCDGVMHMTYIGGWQDRQQRGIEVALSTARPKNKNQREGSAANNQSPPGSGAERPCTLSEMTKLLSVGTVIWATVTFFAGGSPTAGSYFDAPSGFYRSRGEGVSFALTFVAGAHDT